MKVRIKKMWVNALRSGEFKQGRQKLRVGRGKDVRHCCLGVLEQLRVIETGGKFRGGSGEFCNLLSRKTQKWAGLGSPDPVLMPLRVMTASELNDDGKSFKFIADKIEKQL